MRVKTAVFPVAGMGTRLLPATKAVPKEMVTLIDRPLIQYAVEEALDAGIEKIVFVTSKAKKSLEDHFDINLELEETLEASGKTELLKSMRRISMMCDVIYVRQKIPKGLGHAVQCARDVVGNEPFAVILPDDIILSKKPVVKQLVEQFRNVGSTVLSLMEVPQEDTSKYGIVDIKEKINDRLFSLNEMVEKPKENPPSNLAIIGRYILTPDIFDVLEKGKEGTGGEIQLTDAIKEIGTHRDIYGYMFEGKRFDCGNLQGLLEATVHFGLSRPDTGDFVRELIKSTAEKL